MLCDKTLEEPQRRQRGLWCELCRAGRKKRPHDEEISTRTLLHDQIGLPCARPVPGSHLAASHDNSSCWHSAPFLEVACRLHRRTWNIRRSNPLYVVKSRSQQPRHRKIPPPRRAPQRDHQPKKLQVGSSFSNHDCSGSYEATGRRLGGWVACSGNDTMRESCVPVWHGVRVRAKKEGRWWGL